MWIGHHSTAGIDTACHALHISPPCKAPQGRLLLTRQPSCCGLKMHGHVLLSPRPSLVRPYPRKFFEDGHRTVVAQSFAKNMGLYGQRTGALSVVCDNANEASAVQSQIKVGGACVCRVCMHL